jgi:hypothetical protein
MLMNSGNIAAHTSTLPSAVPSSGRAAAAAAPAAAITSDRRSGSSAALRTGADSFCAIACSSTLPLPDAALPVATLTSLAKATTHGTEDRCRSLEVAKAEDVAETNRKRIDQLGLRASTPVVALPPVSASAISVVVPWWWDDQGGDDLLRAVSAENLATRKRARLRVVELVRGQGVVDHGAAMADDKVVMDGKNILSTQ